MTEGTKALNSAVSTLKKNPGRIGRLVKAAQFLIVPPKQYSKGKARELAEAAIAKLKAKRGLNGVVGEGAGSFSDKALQKKAMEKKAVDKKTQDRALAASAVGSGAALGGVLTHDAKKSRVTSRMGIKGAYKHMANPSVEGAEKRLANSAKTLRRMGKPLRRAGIKGAIVGGLAGAALGAAHLKKEASVLNFRTVQQRAQQAFQHYKNHDARVAALKAAGKKAAIVAGVTGAGVAVTKKNEQLKKQASDLVIKDGKKYRKGTVASAANTMAAVNGTLRAVGKGGIKSVAKSALNGGLLGGAYGTVRGANRLRKGEISLDAKEMKKLRGHKKEAAEMIERDGKKYRKGTPGSAATNMGAFNTGAQLANNVAAIQGAKHLGIPAGGRAAYMKDLPKAAVGGAVAGYLYGKARDHFRKKRGEESLNHSDFAKKKAAK